MWSEVPTVVILFKSTASELGVRYLADGDSTKISIETWLKVGLVSSLFLSVLVISIVSWDKTTVLSPYNNAADEYSMQQLTEMRNVVESNDFSIANTMSTPMLVRNYAKTAAIESMLTRCYLTQVGPP